jgi:ribosomal protein L37E
MEETIVCDLCGTEYDVFEKVCPVCGRVNQ